MLATRNGKCIRFQVDDIRIFSGRTSTGVRGIRLADGDEVIGMSMLRHVDADADDRAAYLRQANAERRAAGEEASSDEAPDPDAEVSTNIALSRSVTKSCAPRKSSSLRCRSAVSASAPPLMSTG